MKSFHLCLSSKEASFLHSSTLCCCENFQFVHFKLACIPKSNTREVQLYHHFHCFLQNTLSKVEAVCTRIDFLTLGNGVGRDTLSRSFSSQLPGVGTLGTHSLFFFFRGRDRKHLEVVEVLLYIWFATSTSRVLDNRPDIKMGYQFAGINHLEEITNSICKDTFK